MDGEEGTTSSGGMVFQKRRSRARSLEGEVGRVEIKHQRQSLQAISFGEWFETVELLGEGTTGVVLFFFFFFFFFFLLLLLPFFFFFFFFLISSFSPFFSLLSSLIPSFLTPFFFFFLQTIRFLSVE